MFPRRAVLLIAAAVLAAGLAGAALASGGGVPPDDRVYPPPGVTAIGSGSSPITPRGLRSERKIRAAVAAAGARAMPRAMASARRRAAAIAASSGLQLGEVWAVEQEANVPYYGSGIEQGTFGVNRFCGRIRSRRAATRGRWVRTCRVPRESTVYLRVSFARK